MKVVERSASNCNKPDKWLTGLVQNNLTEMKAFASPPAAVVSVAAAVMCLLAPGGKVPKDKSWKSSKANIMSKVMGASSYIGAKKPVLEVLQSQHHVQGNVCF